MRHSAIFGEGLHSALATVEPIVGFYFLDNHNGVEVNKLCDWGS